MKRLDRKLLWLCLSIVSLLLPATTKADIEIVLNDGEVFRLPIKEKEIKAIKVDGDQYFPGTLHRWVKESRPDNGKGRGVSYPIKRRVLRVGPGRKIELPSEAARTARDGEAIEIDAVEYFGDVAVWKANNITIGGAGGLARLDAGGKSAQGKAIWVIRGNDVTVDNIEFSHAKVRDKNGAGIRAEGNNLTVRNCVFRDNEEGILGGGNRHSSMLVEHCVFARNGYGDGQSHGIYVSAIKRLTFQYNYVHHTKVGHHVKSEARENFMRSKTKYHGFTRG